MKPITAPRRTETIVGVGIVFVLAAIAGGVFLRQNRFSPAILSPETIAAVAATPGAAHSTGSAPAESATFPVPSGLVPLSPVESFGPDTLSDKIDGKADLYLVAGFIELVCQRLVDADNRADWLEVYQFDMGNARNAFTVFSNQRRAEAESLDVTPLAYQTANALFFVAGQHYLEIIAATPADTLRTAMHALARDLAAALDTAADAFPELALLPAAGLQPDSVELLAADAFGFGRLDQVLIGRYPSAAGSVTAFISQRASAAAAAELAAAYREFLLANGGTARPAPDDLPAAQVIEIIGTYEVVAAHGSVLAGVHSAESIEAALTLARALAAHIEKVRK